MKVLICEDEPDISYLIQRRLAREGYDLVLADNGLDALRLAIEERPGLIVLDWMMPGLTGLEVCTGIRANPVVSGTKILMLTARAHQRDLTAAFDAGVDDYLIKPFRPGELHERVAALLSRA